MSTKPIHSAFKAFSIKFSGMLTALILFSSAMQAANEYGLLQLHLSGNIGYFTFQ